MFAAISLFYSFCLIVLLFLAGFIYWKAPRSWLNRYFALSALALFGWLLSLLVFNRSSEPDALLWLGRLNFAFIPFAVYLGYLFVAELVRDESKANARVSAGSILLGVETSLLGLLTLLTPAIDRAETVQAGGHQTVFGVFFPLYVIHVVLYLCASVYLIYRGVRDGPARQRAQLNVIGAGILATATIALITNVILPFGFRIFAFDDIGALSTVLYLGAVAYAISFHHLFDIRIIIRRTVVFGLLLAFVLAVYSGGILFLAELLPGGGVIGRMALQVISILVIAFSFDPLRRILEGRTDRFLFRKEYERQAVLTELAACLNSVTALDDALKAVLHTLQRALHPASAAIFVFERREGDTLSVKRLQQVGSRATARLLSLAQPGVLDYLKRHGAFATTDTEPLPGHSHSTSTEQGQWRQVREELRTRGIATALPLLVGKRLIGVITLGPKHSGESFSREDRELLGAIGLQTISGIQKAELYEGDQLKSEFVSIAAHELLTPITAVQGYLSMILDEHLGKVDDRARGYLSKAYPALDRLLLLVKDLLSISRLESGRVTLHPQPIDTLQIIQEVIDQLAPSAREKKLRLSLEHPDGHFPPAFADPGRTMEILTNLVGNAIKYTPQGLVTIKVSQQKDPEKRIRIDITDTGLGISKEAQAHLFQKFYRVTTAQTSRIQGTGLGLYITKSLVEKMGGSIEVRSSEGTGSTFSVLLPSAPGSADRSAERR